MLTGPASIVADHSKTEFGKKLCISNETVLVNVLLPYGSKKRLHSAIVPTDVQVLFQLDVIRENGLTLDLNRGKVRSRQEWSFCFK